jgi:hypothetical protein
MKKISVVSLLMFVSACLVGCGATKQSTPATPTTNITAGAWVTTINNFVGGQTDTVTVQVVSPNGTLAYDGSGPAVGYTSCDNDGLTYYNPPQTGGTPVVGPACFVALGYGCNGGCVDGTPTPNITSTDSVEPGDFIIGIPVNPAPNGSAFNISYNELSGSTVWQMDGSGTIINGTASGTWVCDPSTPACSGITGTFTATLQ